MERIIIIGCGGAGKSTLARQLSEKTGIPVVHLDKLFWRPGWVSVPPEEFDQLHRRELAREKWIMDGNFNRTLPERLRRCDTVIYLDYGRLTCLLGVMKRILTTYGQVRLDMGEGCPERVDMDFLKWVWNFNKVHRAKNYELLKTAPHAQIHILKNRHQTAKFLKNC